MVLNIYTYVVAIKFWNLVLRVTHICKYERSCSLIIILFRHVARISSAALENAIRGGGGGGLNVRIYGGGARRDSEHRGALDGTAKRTHPRSRVRGIRTINRSA